MRDQGSEIRDGGEPGLSQRATEREVLGLMLAEDRDCGWVICELASELEEGEIDVADALAGLERAGVVHVSEPQARLSRATRRVAALLGW